MLMACNSSGDLFSEELLFKGLILEAGIKECERDDWKLRSRIEDAV